MSYEINKEEFLTAFLEEVEEQLQLFDECILELEQKGESAEIIQRIFRVAHTLKGSSSAMGFDEMKNLTHGMEDVLDQIRNNTLCVTGEMISLLFDALDHLKVIKEEYASGQEATVREDLIIGLRNLLDKPKSETSSMQAKKEDDQKQELPKEGNDYQCTFVIQESCAFKLVRGFVIKSLLENFGTIMSITPSLEQEGVEDSAFSTIEFLIQSEENLAAIEEKCNTLAEIEDFTICPIKQKEEEKPEQPEQPKGQVNEITAQKAPQSIRVDVDRLEKLMNLVGELVIDQTRINQVGTILGQRYHTDETVVELDQISAHFSRVISELQETVMKTRMIPIEKLFNRFPRMMRDLSKSLDKEVNFIMEGHKTELDRNVIEEIGDPIIHLLRNAIDHGLETPEKREANGKTKTGTIRLTASHEENHVIISIEDDGAGIDPEKITQSALKKGLIKEDDAQALTQQQINQLIFHPGFSTSAQISDVSGRGVGMDIVRSHIEKLNGIIDIETTQGKGTKFIVKLPLTLAILTGLLVKLNQRIYALPMTSIVEIVRVSANEIQTIHQQEVIKIRDQVVPLLWLHDFLQVPRVETKKKNLSIIIVGIAEKKIGLVVDELLGNQDIVVKSLGSYIGKMEGVSGATILGDGSVALIVDVTSLSKAIQNQKPLLHEVTN
ncbi:chemotaxis protein CheA [Bacillus sp. BGMRC 2118]|nr:chemotaxis protein CheA [Bacillus sp. BGMRC 2118]